MFFWARIDEMAELTWLSAPLSSADVASSRRSTLGLRTSARAIATEDMGSSVSCTTDREGGKRGERRTALLLSTAQAGLADHRLKPLGQVKDELAVGRARRPNDVLLARSWRAIGDVLEDGAGEERRVLRDDAELVAPRLGREGPDIIAVKRDVALVRVVVAQEEAVERTLARAARATEPRRQLRSA